MIRLKISSKVLVYFLLVSLLPLFTVSLILSNKAKSLLLNAAITKQQIVANSTAERVDVYLEGKVSDLGLQSKLLATNISNANIASKDFEVFINQDKSVQDISLLDANGQQKVIVDKNGAVFSPVDKSTSDSFKAIEYLVGKNFISSVNYNAQGEPLITIAVPLLSSAPNQSTGNGTTTNSTTAVSTNNFLGAIVATYNISDLWNSVLSTTIGQGGYAYVVDGLGNLVAHPNKQFLIHNQKITDVQAVNLFINGNFSTAQTTSETGQAVISTPKKIINNNWAVIVEEPTTSIYQAINSFIRLSEVIIFLAVLFAVVLSLLFRKQLLDPIKKLILATEKVARGDFNYQVTVNSKDELHDLATTFNIMSQQIDKLIEDLNIKNINLNHATAQLSVVNEQLKKADSTKDDFISMASHQLGTPLVAIEGYITLASEGYYGILNEKLESSLKSALDRTQVMKSLLSDLLDVSRMTANRLYLNVTKTDLNLVVEKEVKGLSTAANLAEVQLTYHSPHQPIPLINLDQQKSQQAVSNLVNNAINYSNGGKVDVYLLSDGVNATFKVVDNGIGVPESDKSKLFNKFYRADNAKKARPDGTGIGLYLVRRVIEDQGGRIIFQSEQGSGSTFGFIFPINSTLTIGQHLTQSDKANTDKDS